MNAKRRRFVAEYLKDQNGTQAAIRAGYSPKTANEQASQLLANLNVRQAVDAGLERVVEQCGITAGYVLKSLKSVAERCMVAEPVMRKEDGEWVETGEYQFDSSGANRALELLGKHLALFNEEKGGDDDERNPYLRFDPAQFGNIVQLLDRELAARKNGHPAGNGAGS